jgi:hypothetical protein
MIGMIYISDWKQTREISLCRDGKRYEMAMTERRGQAYLLEMSVQIRITGSWRSGYRLDRNVKFDIG